MDTACILFIDKLLPLLAKRNGIKVKTSPWKSRRYWMNIEWTAARHWNWDSLESACKEYLGNKWVWECEFNRQVRASACTRLCVFAWGERGGWGEDSNAALSAPKLRLFRRCVAERTTIPSLSTRFSAYTATSAYIITVHVHDNVAQQHPQFKKKRKKKAFTHERVVRHHSQHIPKNLIKSNPRR